VDWLTLDVSVASIPGSSLIEAHTGTRTRDAYGTCTGRVHGPRDAYTRDAYGTRTGRVRACWEVHRTQAVGRVLGRVQDAYRFPLGRKHQPPLVRHVGGAKISIVFYTGQAQSMRHRCIQNSLLPVPIEYILVQRVLRPAEAVV
jgi:hypothetical protein